MSHRSGKPLANLHVVVTRPTTQAQYWQTRLQNEGASVSLLPVLAIEPVVDESAKQKIKNCILALDQYQKVIFVSQNAVVHAWRWIDEYWPQAPTGIVFFAIGSSTEKCLREHARNQGVAIKSGATAMNTEELLALPELQSVKSEKILVFRGCGGRPLLADQLRKRGAKVEICELYRRLLPSAAAESLQALLPGLLAMAGDASNSDKNCVLSVHSGESLENLNQVLQMQVHNGEQLAKLKALPIVVPGRRVTELANKLGYQRTITALNATDDAMTEALRHFNSLRGDM